MPPQDGVPKISAIVKMQNLFPKHLRKILKVVVASELHRIDFDITKLIANYWT